MANKKAFKAESKKLMDMMIHSIYTHKEIFLRELISNASDAMDKLYYKALSENLEDINKSDLKIDITVNEEARTITIADNGIGMNAIELEENLGTIARSGSFDFKENNETNDVIERIKAVIDKVRPYLQNDGGDVEFIRYENGVAYVKLIGACSKCPMAQMTLQDGIENALISEVPEVIKVIGEN